MKQIESKQDGRAGPVSGIQPSSRKDEIVGWNEAGELRVRLAAPPVEGAANKRIPVFLARQLGLKKRDIVIESGERSRSKLLSAPVSARAKLEELPDA
ncbi:MAG: DUF167 domain-containing protein [Candidatus Krumholzibacteria bacterium]|nr:DUF167 domain-containing protein [Candidatus Krumholzibacteria bacterium]